MDRMAGEIERLAHLFGIGAFIIGVPKKIDSQTSGVSIERIFRFWWCSFGDPIRDVSAVIGAVYTANEVFSAAFFPSLPTPSISATRMENWHDPVSAYLSSADLFAGLLSPSYQLGGSMVHIIQSACHGCYSNLVFSSGSLSTNSAVRVAVDRALHDLVLVSGDTTLTSYCEKLRRFD